MCTGCWQVETALGQHAAEAALAGDELDRFCRRCCNKESQLVNSASYFQSGQMLVEAIQGALPRTNAIQVCFAPFPSSLVPLAPLPGLSSCLSHCIKSNSTERAT